MSKKLIEKYFSGEDLKKISASINAVEMNTSGEIRLCVQEKKAFLERSKSPREIALGQFKKLGMHKTKHRTGVLIYILLHDKKFEVVADEGINKIIEQQVWDDIENSLSQEFKQGNFLQGVLHSINLIGTKLKGQFPREHDDTDELSNEVVIK